MDQSLASRDRPRMLKLVMGSKHVGGDDGGVFQTVLLK